ncbi:glutathione S-transferase family protein [Halorhodospira halochloris]|uniref:glutathione S-transferase family protein n=1 Tax=Halorhodospira halochloris TaxID=1052 RepID=UPI001EE841B4|nr:glutathione S-transferase family protein [Halorhodospira halochloris]MCG5531035.1 glutathione S-transferase family protein [Halorhodospira halochloris]
MGLLIEGQWVDQAYQRDEAGRFQRQRSTFRNWIGHDSEFPPEPGRYHLYVSYACPWAQRILIARHLKGLEDAITVSVVHPLMLDNGWELSDDFPGATGDPILGAKYLYQVYTQADPTATTRVTVPALWDKEQKTLVNNESRDLLRMFDHNLSELATHNIDLAPAEIRGQVDATIDAIYEPINNGVYRCGFAATQQAYEEAAEQLYAALDYWEEVLGRQRYLCGEQLTEADICLYTTLIRFDAVYAVHFKCSQRQIREYPNLMGYLRELYQMPAFGSTTDFEHIRHHYFRSHGFLNPNGIIARMPELGLDKYHGRE